MLHLLVWETTLLHATRRRNRLALVVLRILYVGSGGGNLREVLLEQLLLGVVVLMQDVRVLKRISLVGAACVDIFIKLVLRRGIVAN